MSKTILVIEDDKDVRELICIFLTIEDYTVRMAPNGIEGLNIASSQSIDLIISDIDMPGMDGLNACAQIKRLPGFANVPYIFITASDDYVDITLANYLGIAAYIPKPFDHKTIVSTVNALLKSDAMPNDQMRSTTHMFR